MPPDVFSSTLEPAVLTDFIREGHFARHTRRMRMLHPERRTALLTALPIQMGGRLEVIGTEAGMHPAALLAPGTNDVAASRKPAQRGISALPLSSGCSTPPTEGRLDSWLRRHRHTSDSPWNAQTQQERTGPAPIARLRVMFESSTIQESIYRAAAY